MRHQAPTFLQLPRRIEAFDKPDQVITLASGVQAELLLDPPDHRPADDPDTEIIERVLAARWLTAKPIAIVTNDDSGMQFS